MRVRRYGEDGVSWQIVPSMLPALLDAPDPAKSGRAMRAMFQMKKLDISAEQRVPTIIATFHLPGDCPCLCPTAP